MVCADRGLHFDAINTDVAESPYSHLGTGRKIFADYYIDDKAMFPTWEAFSGGLTL